MASKKPLALYSGMYQEIASGDLVDPTLYAGNLYGTFAARPSSAPTGAIHYPSDGYFPSVYTGSEWHSLAIPGFPSPNPPAVSTFTQVNTGTEMGFVDSKDCILATLSGYASTAQKGIAFLKALAGGNYALTVGLELYLQPVQYAYFGLILAEGTLTSNKHVEFQCTWGNGVPYLNGGRFSDVNTDAGGPYFTYNHGIFPMANGRFFMRFRDDGTYRYYEISQDGYNFNLIYYVGRTDYVTPTHAGVVFGQAGTSVAAAYQRVRAKIFYFALG